MDILKSSLKTSRTFAAAQTDLNLSIRDPFPPDRWGGGVTEKER